MLSKAGRESRAVSLRQRGLRKPECVDMLRPRGCGLLACGLSGSGLRIVQSADRNRRR
jgi:hypothetical protein